LVIFCGRLGYTVHPQRKLRQEQIAEYFWRHSLRSEALFFVPDSEQEIPEAETKAARRSRRGNSEAVADKRLKTR
jgi:hypothetical protein